MNYSSLDISSIKFVSGHSFCLLFGFSGYEEKRQPTASPINAKRIPDWREINWKNPHYKWPALLKWAWHLHVDSKWRKTNNLDCSIKPSSLTLIVWSLLSPACLFMGSPKHHDSSFKVTQSCFIISSNVPFFPAYAKCQIRGIIDNARHGAIFPTPLDFRKIKQ